MTDVQRLRMALDKSRKRVAELLAKDARSTDESNELQALASTITADMAALSAAESVEASEQNTPDNPPAAMDAETRERLALLGRVSLADALHGAATRSAQSEVAELQAAWGCRGNRIPIGLLLDQSERQEMAVTNPPSNAVNVQDVTQIVLPESVAQEAGMVHMPMVGSGLPSYPVVTTAPPAATRAAGSAAPNTAAAIANQAPDGTSRISGAVETTLEGRSLAGYENYDPMLRSALRLSIAQALDKQILTGNGTAPNVSGILDQLTDPADSSAVETFDSLLSAYAGGVDGIFARGMEDVRLVGNLDLYKLAAKTFRDATIDKSTGAAAARGETAFTEYAKMHTAGLVTTPHAHATSSNIAQTLLVRTGRPNVRRAILPHWGMLEIDNPYVDDLKATTRYSAHWLVANKVVLTHASAFSRLDLKVS